LRWIYIGRIFLEEEIYGRGEGVKIPGKILHWGYLTEFLTEILVNCLTLSLSAHFCMWRCSGGIFPGLFSACFDFLKKLWKVKIWSD